MRSHGSQLVDFQIVELRGISYWSQALMSSGSATMQNSRPSFKKFRPLKLHLFLFYLFIWGDIGVSHMIPIKFKTHNSS